VRCLTPHQPQGKTWTVWVRNTPLITGLTEAKAQQYVALARQRLATTPRKENT